MKPVSRHRGDGFTLEDGFTLIELMVVVLIIGILVAIALPTFLGARTRAQDAASKAILKTALTGAKAYFLGAGTYTGFDAPGAPEAEETGLRWVYPSSPAVKEKVTLNLAQGNLVVMSVASESGTFFCMLSNEDSGGGLAPMVRGGVDANGATTIAPLCLVETW